MPNGSLQSMPVASQSSTSPQVSVSTLGLETLSRSHQKESKKDFFKIKNKNKNVECELNEHLLFFSSCFNTHERHVYT